MNENYKATMPQVVIRFFNYQSNVKNKSELTIDEYCLDLRLFFKFLVISSKKTKFSEDELDATDISGLTEAFFCKITLDDAYRFLSYCKNFRNNQEKARARKVSSIRTFFKYLKMNGYIDDNPMINLDSPKLKKSLPKYLTVEQAQKLLMSVEGKNKERDYCILTLFLNCGLRLSELVSIDYNKILFDETNNSFSVVITGKGNKERTVYFNDACVFALKSYLRVRPKDGVKDRNALFLSNRLTRISIKTVQHIVDVYLEKAGLGGQGFSTHKLRHTAATLMYQTGEVDILELKEILGHENLNTTQIYTHLLDEKLKEAVAKNPLSGFNVKKSTDDND
ncbi:MAG: tyrosine recombinase XerC [Ruminococcaceae bacterium]|nr:tyrosine recombinase XerC [Oscillospiraceae bacterium]MBR3597013.1 tyrosine recombinase XerC [Clostridia bacterium]